MGPVFCNFWFIVVLNGFFRFEEFLTNLVVKIELLVVQSNQFIIDQSLSKCKDYMQVCKAWLAMWL